MQEIETLFGVGIEKVALNTAAAESPSLVTQAARAFGSQSIVVSIDVRKPLQGRHEVWTRGATQRLSEEPVAYARRMQELGAGELLLTSVDRDGTRAGYDLALVRQITAAVSVPVVAAGGASGVADLTSVVRDAGASAAAAGSLFVFQGKHQAVLITYPERAILEQAFAP